MKARGFVERAGMVLCGALPPSEFQKLRNVVPFSDAEEEMVGGWTSRPGGPFRVVLTDAELSLNDTNKRWKTKSRIHAAEEFGAGHLVGDCGWCSRCGELGDLLVRSEGERSIGPTLVESGHRTDEYRAWCRRIVSVARP